MYCCELRLVTKSQYRGKRDRTPARVSRTYTSRRAGSARAQRAARDPPIELERTALILDIGLQPAELDDCYRDGHDEQDDGLGAGEAVAAELEGSAVHQLDDRDRGVVRSATVGH